MWTTADALDPKIPSGRIAVQEPPPGSTTRRQRSIHVWMSQGRARHHYPGAHRRERTQRRSCGCSRTACRSSALSEVRSSDYPKRNGHRAGTAGRARTAPKSRCSSIAASRADGYVMPDLIGVAGNRAVDLLRARGFRVTIVGEIPYPGIPAGIVLRQSPPAGFQIARRRSDFAGGQP